MPHRVIEMPHGQCYLSVIVRGTDSLGRRTVLWKTLRISLSVDKWYLEISLATRMYISISARRRPVCVRTCVCVCECVCVFVRALPCMSNYIPVRLLYYLKHYLLVVHSCLVPIAYVYTRSQHVVNISYHSSLSVRIQKEVMRKP